MVLYTHDDGIDDSADDDFKNDDEVEKDAILLGRTQLWQRLFLVRVSM